MRRPRKIIYGLLSTLVVMLGCEGAARAYSAIRFGNPGALRYGLDLFRHLGEGTATLEEGWGAGRGGDAAARDRQVAEGTVSAQLFQNRNNINDGLSPGEPRVVTFNNGIPAQINSLNFRGPEIAKDGPPGTLRIALFGGSYVFGAYLRDDQTWAYLLEQKMNARGKPTEVINAGNSGANVHAVMEDVIRLTNRARIDVAVVTTAYNNHPLLPIRRRYTATRRVDYYLYNSSLFYVIFKERLAKAMAQPLDFGLYRQAVRVRAADVESLVTIYKTRLDQIATVCDERKIRLVLATQPQVFFQSDLNEQSTQTRATIDALTERIRDTGMLYIAELEYYLQGRLNLALRDVAASRNALVFDGEAALLENKRRNFADQIHPNEIGAEKLAGALDTLLAEQFIVDQGHNRLGTGGQARD